MSFAGVKELLNESIWLRQYEEVTWNSVSRWRWVVRWGVVLRRDTLQLFTRFKCLINSDRCVGLLFSAGMWPATLTVHNSYPKMVPFNLNGLDKFLAMQKIVKFKNAFDTGSQPVSKNTRNSQPFLQRHCRDVLETL